MNTTAAPLHDAHVLAFFQSAQAAYIGAQSKLRLILRGMSYVAELDCDNIRREQALRVCALHASDARSEVARAALELKIAAQYVR